MGILKYYRYVCNYGVNIEETTHYVAPPKRRREYVAPEAVPVTVANLDKRFRDYVTAHDLRDYRRTSFNIVMLPTVELPYDVIAKEVYGLNEYL